MSSKPKHRRRVKAWLIKSVRYIKGTQHETRILGILDSRTSSKTVTRHLEFLYRMEFEAPEEWIGLMRPGAGPEVMPARAPVGTIDSGKTVPWQGLLMIGMNSFVEARLVENLRLDEGKLAWDDIPLPVIPLESVPGHHGVDGFRSC